MTPKAATRKPVTVVTGASSGIGRAIAREFAAHGYDLVIVARRRARLEALKRELVNDYAVRVRVVEADLYDPATPDRLARLLAREPIGIIVNNAGTLEGGSFASMPRGRVLEMLQLNVTALVTLTHAMLPRLLARGGGRIVNVASIAAFAPIPWLGVYAATKAFVLSFGESLGEELRERGVTVTTVCPGLTDSEMADAALERAPGLKPWRGQLFAPATEVARAAYGGCMSADPVVVPGLTNRAYDGLMQAAPRPLRRFLSRYIARSLR
ncbi:MAG: SDR family oxidoreductase [Steroidobacteraceae bacterium]|nr:SDR family oxidoreductase [Steroidobacteraceae bacterium]